MGFVLLLFASTEGWSLPPGPKCTGVVWANYIGPCSSGVTKFIGKWKNGIQHGDNTATWSNVIERFVENE